MAQNGVSPLLLSRIPTIYSLAQLSDGEAATGPEAGGPLKTPLSTDPVSDIAGVELPTYYYCVDVARDGDGSQGAAPREARSDSPPAEDGSAQAQRPGRPPKPRSSPAKPRPRATVGPDGSFTPAADRPLMPPPREPSRLMTVLLSEWEDRAERGLFRYDVTQCPTRLLPGARGFLAQLNEGRLTKKRPTEFRVDQVAQAFDAGKFHFGKAAQREVLFALAARGADGPDPGFVPAAPAAASPSLVFINVSPIEYGHVLLVPSALSATPQLVAERPLLEALCLAREVDCDAFRLGYNSLGAYGTVNHLHFQAYFVWAPLALESAAVERVGGQDVVVSRTTNHPARAVLFEGRRLEALARAAAAACEALTLRGVPHNLFITGRGQRVFLIPNTFAEKKAKGLIPQGGRDCWV